jgi:hypothetical protein
MRVAAPLAWAFADGPVPHGFTDGASAARSLSLAGVNTLMLYTCPVVRTFLIKIAFTLFDYKAKKIKLDSLVLGQRRKKEERLPTTFCILLLYHIFLGTAKNSLFFAFESCSLL